MSVLGLLRSAAQVRAALSRRAVYPEDMQLGPEHPGAGS